MKNLDVMGSRDTFCKMMKKVCNKMRIKVIVVSSEFRSQIFRIYQLLYEIEVSVQLEIIEGLRNIGMSYLRAELSTSRKPFLR